MTSSWRLLAERRALSICQIDYGKIMGISVLPLEGLRGAIAK